ncbi:MAG: NADPH-dependent 7-cyano-7-deazaguanine reductase QueF [Ketobacter sp.]|nr:NADPH-dependent 7-cyano-7-deazaguanine reductase QueF [Ketobacter sp.]
MSDQQNGPLGQSSAYPDQYDPAQLHAIPRKLGRLEIGVDENSLPFHGEDVWNAYELSWLNPKGKPVVALMFMVVPANSPNIVESKSLKLYLGSYNQTVMASVRQVTDKIAEDIGKVVGAKIRIELTELAWQGRFEVVSLPGRCIDDLDVDVSAYEVDSSLLTTEDHFVHVQLHSHLLRSCCPVTGQPDWASVLIEYSGNRICEEGLLKYLISFRSNQEFHEQCVERIFMDISRQCKPEKLSVYARYTRRGGIDINPFRSSDPRSMANLRLVRQ